MSFVGRSCDRRLAQLEAALKMLDALQLLPDHASNFPKDAGRRLSDDPLLHAVNCVLL